MVDFDIPSTKIRLLGLDIKISIRGVKMNITVILHTKFLSHSLYAWLLIDV
jgi:hypothetical protein